MKIPEPSSVYPSSGLGPVDSSRAAARAPRGDSAPTGSSQAASVSTLAASASELSSVALNQPDVRQGLVEALRTQVSSGTYQVNSQTLASAMLDDPLSGMADGK